MQTAHVFSSITIVQLKALTGHLRIDLPGLISCGDGEQYVESKFTFARLLILPGLRFSGVSDYIIIFSDFYCLKDAGRCGLTVVSLVSAPSKDFPLAWLRIVLSA